MKKQSFPDTPRLRWVLVEGNLCEVSMFSDLSPQDRPDVFCPICERQVTLKLGKKRAHHFAHRPEDICASINPETALHLNCKFHIYRQLQAATEVYTSTSCGRCRKQKPLLWKQDWDAVEVEYKVDSLRPDIVLLQNNNPIGAIEIFVTHAVNDLKAQRLQNLGVDWVEVVGRENIYEEPNAWIATQPLNPYKQHPSPPSWVCPDCQQLQKKEDYRKNHYVEIFCAKMIDLYFKSGKKYRHVFYVKQAFSYGKKTRIWIENEDREIIANEKAPIMEQSEQRLNEAFRQKLLEFRRKAAIVDDNMGWVRWIPNQKFVARDIDNFPFRYVWNDKEKKWSLQSQLKWKKLG